MKQKYYPFELENTPNSGIFSMEVIFRTDFLKTLPTFEQITRGK